MGLDNSSDARSDGLDGLDEALASHQRVRRQLPNTWNAIFARFGTLRDIQLKAIPALLAGSDTLVTAPTAGGKTEAIIAPLAEQLIAQKWPGLSIVIITPTRALVNDLHARLDRPLGELRLAIGRKTADHHLSVDAGNQILITTPESTESLLTFHRELLKDLRAIVLDEIHLLDGNPRGDQLRLILARLRRFLSAVRGGGSSGLQTIAMSATVAQPDSLARRYLTDPFRIVKAGGQRDVEARYEVADGDWDAGCITRHFSDAQKILIFVNSRKLVDTGVDVFRRCGLQYSVFGHHGSLHKSEREAVEERFRSERRAACIATMTLEVGIDIGDVDLVVCVDPPFSLASFLQRIGRGCRRLQGRTRVLCIARNHTDRLVFEALVNQARLGMPAAPGVPFRRSVLIQQIRERSTNHYFNSLP